MKNKHNQIHNTENLEDIEIKLTRVLQIQKDLKQRLSAMNSKY